MSSPYIIYQEPSPTPQLALPGTSDLALALREPALLVPGRDATQPLLVRRQGLPVGSTHFLYRRTAADANGRTSFVNLLAPGVALTNDSSLDTLLQQRGVLVNAGGTDINSLSIGSRSISATGVFWTVICVGVYVPQVTTRIALGGLTSSIFYLEAVAGGLELYGQAGSVVGSGDVISTPGLYHYALRAMYDNGTTKVEAWRGGRKIWNLTSLANRTFTNTVKACGFDSFKKGFLANAQSGFSYYVYSDQYSPDALLAEISRDPYNTLLQPANSSPYLLSIPGGATPTLPTLTNPTLVSAGGNTYQPRVTATY